MKDEIWKEAYKRDEGRITIRFGIITVRSHAGSSYTIEGALIQIKGAMGIEVHMFEYSKLWETIQSFQMLEEEWNCFIKSKPCVEKIIKFFEYINAHWNNKNITGKKCA